MNEEQLPSQDTKQITPPTIQPSATTPDNPPVRSNAKKIIAWAVGLTVLFIGVAIALWIALVSNSTTTPTIDNHLTAVVRERGVSKALTALYVNASGTLASQYIAPVKDSAAYLEFIQSQVKALNTEVNKLDENKASINGDRESYKEFEVFLATSKQQRDYIVSLMNDLSKTKSIFPQATKYSAIYGNPLNSFDLLSETPATVKAAAQTAKKELETIIAALNAYTPTNELAKAMHQEYLVNFTNQVKYADALIANDGDMTPNVSADNTKPVPQSSNVKEIDTKGLNSKLKKTFDDFKKTFDSQKAALDTKLTDYLTSPLKVPKNELDTKLKATVELMKAELGQELYSSFQRTLK